MTTLEYALAYVHAGFSIIPIAADGTKSPAVATWKEFQRRLPTESEVRLWFTNTRLGIAIICGAVSGNLEVLDFDSAAAWKKYLDLLDKQAPELRRRLPSASTPQGGVHVYLCHRRTVKGNRKLAKSADGKTLIETRGEGGYVLAPGSPPACHPSGKLYAWIVRPEGVPT